MFNDRRFDRSREPRTMHDAVCEECKQPCQVPFEPKKDRPVYCRDCFSKRKPSF